MDKQEKQPSLSDFRAKTMNKQSIVVFGKSIMGYNIHEVNDCIITLKESLFQAENSFKNRLEEYSSMTAMLTQERDKYKNSLKDTEGVNLELQNRIQELSHELEDLKKQLDTESENVLSEDDLKMYEDIISQNSELNEKLSEQEAVIDENLKLKEQIRLLEITNADLSEQIEVYSKNEVSKEQYDTVVSENEIIKQHYDEVVSERSILLAEKNILVEHNNRLSEGLNDANEKIKELRDLNTKTKLKARKIMAEFETKAYECGQSHRRNIEQISENINNALNIIRFENTDISKLLRGATGEFDLNEEIDTELEPIT